MYREVEPRLPQLGGRVVKPPKQHRDGSYSFYFSDPDGTVIQALYEPTISKMEWAKRDSVNSQDGRVPYVSRLTTHEYEDLGQSAEKTVSQPRALGLGSIGERGPSRALSLCCRGGARSRRESP